MKKVERLQWIERTYGSDCVSPYRACYDWPTLEAALVDFEQRGLRPSIRTDRSEGATQGYLMPFLFFTNVEAARKLWDQHRTNLIYIVAASVQPVRVQGVAERLDDEHVFFEVNSKEPMISQRDMYKHPENLDRYIVGPSSQYFWCGRLWRVWRPEYLERFALDQVYSALFRGAADELTFSVKADGRVVIW